jgi:hypothetical protein
MEVSRESVCQVALRLSELGKELTKDVAAEVILPASDFNKTCTPEEVRRIAGGCGILYGKFVCREKILAEESIVSILEVKTVLHPLCLDPFPVRTMKLPELSLVLLLLAGIYPLLEEIIL